MKTVLQEMELSLIAACSELDENNLFQSGMAQAYKNILLDIENNLIEKEKQQIIDAHNNGHDYYDVNGIDAEKYYLQTFYDGK